jgi:hypothetical protein
MSTNTAKVFVQNGEDTPISNVVIMHTSSGNETSCFTVPNLAAGATSTNSMTITYSTSSKDYWWVSFVDTNNDLNFGTSSCGIESEDANGNVIIQLNTASYSVIPPKSSACNSNAYITP